MRPGPGHSRLSALCEPGLIRSWIAYLTCLHFRISAVSRRCRMVDGACQERYIQQSTRWVPQDSASFAPTKQFLIRRFSQLMRCGSPFCVRACTMSAMLLVAAIWVRPSTAQDADPKSSKAEMGRTVLGLQALYNFESAEGDMVRDRSGVGRPLNLKITNKRAVRRSSGRLEVRGKTEIRASQPATKISQAVSRSGQITIEAWVRPADVSLTGPARIVTVSESGTQRNFTLGQDGDRYDVRLRTNGTSANGIPSVSAKKGTVKKALTHVVYTRDEAGRAILYVNGRPNVQKTVKGSISNWADKYKLALANEFGGSRQWKGTYHLVAIYSRRLSGAEVKRHFDAGPNAAAVPGAVARMERPKRATGVAMFEDKIAPLLANHCLECHDSPTRKGGLDLSKKIAALAGGDNGVSIVPGKSDESLLWDYVESGEMPPKRTPLTTDEKKLVRTWLDQGATWSLDVIDPLVYEHDERSRQNWIRRLTVGEYIATVKAAVGVDISKEAYKLLPADLRADGFSNTAYNLNVDLKHIEVYAQLAAIIVERMDVRQFARRFSRSRSLSTDNTMRELVADMGKWLLRGPLNEREITNFAGIATTVSSAGGDFDEAIGLMIEAMLQSPRFIYRVEDQQSDGSFVGEYELASRMSYIAMGRTTRCRADASGR